MRMSLRGVLPENIHFAKGNVLRLSGFISAIEIVQSRPTSRLGPLDYAPPEVLEFQEDEEEANLDEKIDIWQLGVLLFEALSGRCPFEVG